jgi:uncharacterized protein (DUF2147 family)
MNSVLGVAVGMTIFLISCSTFAEDSPVGLWRTFDDGDGRAASLVQIEEKNGLLEGYVVNLLPRPGQIVDAKCDKCKGENKNKPIAGMKILWDMRRDGDEFSGGKIFDPDSGNTYRCKMRIDDKKLVVRGYLGFALFGRSQTWVREPTPTL